MQNPTYDDPPSPLYSGDGASQATSRAAEIGQKAAAAIDDKRDAVARGIASAASTLHAQAEDLPGEKAARAAHSAAAAMDRAADYVRDQDVTAMLSDVQQAAKRNPGVVILAAAALGFLLARALSRN